MNTFAKTALLASTALGLVACGGDGGIGDALNLSSPSARVVNAVPGGPALNVYRGDELQSDAGQPAYGQASQYFQTVSATSVWTVNNSADNSVVATTTLKADGSTRYTLVALPSLTTTGGVDLLQISDPYDVGLTENNARVRVVNAALNEAPFDIYLTQPGADLNTATPTQSNVAYASAAPATGANSTSVSAGTYEVRLTLAGTKTVIFDSSFSVGKDDDELLVALPASEGANDVKLLNVPSASGETVSEITNQQQ